MNVGRALESLRKWTATEQEWRDVLGEEFDDVRPLLSPEGQLAEVIALPGRNELLRVVQHGESDFVAIDPEAPEPIVIPRDSLILWTLPQEGLLRGVMGALGMEPRPARVRGRASLWRLGELRSTDRPLPLYASTANGPSEVSEDVCEVRSLEDSAFILLGLLSAPPPQATRLLAAVHAAWVPLDTALAWQAPGTLWASAPFVSHLPDSMRSRKAVHSAIEPIQLDVPPSTTWSQVKMRLEASGTVKIVIGGQMADMTPRHLGMVDGRSNGTTAAWGLLCRLLQHDGVLESGNQAERIQKQVRTLRRALRAHIPAQGNPLFAQGGSLTATFSCEARLQDP